MKQLGVGGLLVISGVAAAAGTVTQSPEVPVADRVLCPAEADELAMGLGPSGGALVAWLDDRAYPTTGAIVAARVAADGTLLDPTGIYLGEEPSFGDLSVAFDGTHYLVSWSNDSGVYASRIDAATGMVLDPTPIMVAPGSRNAGAVGGNGQFLVAWVDASEAVNAKRIGDDGTILDSAPLVLGGGAFVQGGPSGTFDGTNYAIVWAGAGIQAARVSPSGTVLAPGQVDLVPSIVGFNPSPAIVYSGSQYLVAWDAGALYTMRVSTTLTPVDSPTNVYGGGAPPGLAFDGTRYTLAVEADHNTNPGSVEFANVTAANTLIGNASYSLPGVARNGNAKLLFNGSQLLLASSSDQVVSGVRIATDGTIVDTTPLTWSQTRNDQHNPAIAFDGTSDYMVAWVDSRDTLLRTSIYVARLADSGGLDGSGIVVAAGLDQGGKVGNVALGRPRAPRSTALVVWADEGLTTPGIRAARVDGSGTVLDPGGVTIAASGLDQTSALDVACTATTCLVVWEDPSFNVHGVRVRLDIGSILDSTPLQLGEGLSPRVAASDSGFLVTGGTPTLVPESGAPQPLLLPASAGLASFDAEWDGTSFVYVFTVNTQTTIQLMAVRVDASGTVVGTPALLASVDSTAAVSVVHDGSEWVASWYPWFVSTPPDTIHVARIASDGTVRDPDGIEVATGTGVTAFAGGSDGGFRIVRQVTTAATPDRGTALAASRIAISGDTPGDNPSGGHGGGCCQTGPGDTSPAALAVVVLAAVGRRRRARG